MQSSLYSSRQPVRTTWIVLGIFTVLLVCLMGCQQSLSQLDKDNQAYPSSEFLIGITENANCQQSTCDFYFAIKQNKLYQVKGLLIPGPLIISDEIQNEIAFNKINLLRRNMPESILKSPQNIISGSQAQAEYHSFKRIMYIELWRDGVFYKWYIDANSPYNDEINEFITETNQTIQEISQLIN